MNDKVLEVKPMTILSTAYYNSHVVVADLDKWRSRITITYDGTEVHSERRLSSPLGKYVFEVIEHGKRVVYELELGGFWKIKSKLRRNGVVVFDSEKKEPLQIPPISEQPRNDSLEKQEKIVVKEVVLVVCPHCNHRNDSARRICEKCGASI
ncbi:MAG: hypothetical protein ACFFAZ_15795 [Promethearchaeota archaeon]